MNRTFGRAGADAFIFKVVQECLAKAAQIHKTMPPTTTTQFEH